MQPGGASGPRIQPVVDVAVDPDRARVYEHGWQSWSPTTSYPPAAAPYRPVSELCRLMNYRPDRVAPADAFWGEGLLAVDPGGGQPVHLLAAREPHRVPSIRADVRGERLRLSAEADLEHVVDAGPGGIDGALARWAEGFAAAHAVPRPRPAPTLWCSWYHYFTGVTEPDIDENLQAIDELGLGIDVVQIDDGYQADIGDWLLLSDRFRSLPDLIARIHGRGRAGIWVAPFLVGTGSRLYAEHPDWTVQGAQAGHGWGQDLAALDPSVPGAAAYLREVFGYFADLGIDFLKLDFLFAGAVPGARAEPGLDPIAAYRLGLEVIREAAGDSAYLLGCGAPILPSVGLVDAMRVGPDISHRSEPEDEDQSQPSQRTATRCTVHRGWQHGRFWVNDSDCLLAGRRTADRERWADTVERYGGLRASSDRLRELDEWGLATTRRLIRPVPAEPFPG